MFLRRGAADAAGTCGKTNEHNKAHGGSLFIRLWPECLTSDRGEPTALEHGLNRSAAFSISSVRRVEIEVRTNGNDPGRIDASVAFVIVALDVLKVRRLSHAGPLIQLASEAP